MKRFSLCPNDNERERLARSGCGRLAARIVPDATAEMLQIASDFFIWNVSFDDEYCDEGPLGKRPGDLAAVLSMLLRAIETPENSLYETDRYAVAMCDIRRRLDKVAAPWQMRLWVENIRGWFLAETWKAGNLAAHRMPSLDEYATLRLYSGGALVFPVLTSIVEDHGVTYSELAQRPVHALTEMAATLCTWVSDIISYKKEMEREEGGHNLVNVIQHEYQCSIEQAILRAVILYDQIMSLFLRLRAQVTLQASVGLKRYLISLGHFVRSSVDWCHASERYALSQQSEQTTAVSPVKGEAVPDDFNIQLTISSIAWWWEYDPAKQPGYYRQATTDRL
jgi:hypothetical protein